VDNLKWAWVNCGRHEDDFIGPPMFKGLRNCVCKHALISKRLWSKLNDGSDLWTERYLAST
jgi:hypothetical protein